MCCGAVSCLNTGLSRQFSQRLNGRNYLRREPFRSKIGQCQISIFYNVVKDSGHTLVQ